MTDLHEAIFGLTSAVRYVAVAQGQQVELRSRPGLEEASSAESDRYEELLVNPTLLVLARQRGEIDCGGLRYVIVGYGRFSQLVLPLVQGHVSVAFERGVDPAPYVSEITALAAGHGLPVFRTSAG